MNCKSNFKPTKGYWICYYCATKKGAKWPPNHCGATLSALTCGYCKGKNQLDKFIAPWVDYDWPGVDTRKLRD